MKRIRFITVLIALLFVTGAAYCEEAPAWDIDFTDDDMIRVETCYGAGYVDTSGNIVTPLKWDGITYLGDGMASAQKDDQVYLLDLENGTETPVDADSYRDLRSFSEGLCLVQVDGLWGYADRSGNIVIAPVYDMPDDPLWTNTYVEDQHSFVNGIASVSMDGRYGVIDISGNTVVPLEYDAAYVCE